MKKIKLCAFMIAVSFMYGAATKAATSDAEEIAKMLSTIHGAEVKANIDNDKCEVIYPETEVIDNMLMALQAAGAKIDTNDAKDLIPETRAECRKVADFNSHPQYEITVTSPNKLKAQLYNQLKFAFIKDLTAASMKEEIRVVPELGIMSYGKIHLDDVAITQKDKTTGLKREVGNLRSYDLQQQVMEEAGQVKYEVDNSMDGFNLVLPIFSVQLQSQKQRSEVVYDVPSEGEFDYRDLIKSVPFLQTAKSSALFSGMKIGVALFGVSVGFDMDIKSNVQRAEDESLYILGQIKFDKTVFGGELIDANAQPKSIILKYSIKDISKEIAVEFGKIPEKSDDDSEEAKAARDLQIADLLDKVAEQAKLAANFEVNFAAADIKGNFDMERRNGYLHGVGKITVNNLFNIFPNQKQCANNPQADRLPECANPILASLKDVIDTSKNNSETIYKFTEQGVFKNGVKIGDPIELNFRKMSLEMHAKDMEKQARMEDMMKAMGQAGDLQQP